MGAPPLELSIPSPFPDYTPAFDSHIVDHFADLRVFLRAANKPPLLLHRVLLSRASRTFAALFRNGKAGSASYDSATQSVKGLPSCDAAMVSLLRFCYGAALAVNKDNAVLLLAALAFMKLKKKSYEVRAQLREFIKSTTGNSAADGLAFVCHGEDYDKACGTTFCAGANIARMVFPLVNPETDLQALVDALLTLPPEYLDIVNYGSDKSQAHESDVRVAYVRHHIESLSYDEARKIVSPLRLPELPMRNILQLVSLGLCDNKDTAAVIQKLHDENQVLQRKLAESEKARNSLAKRVKDDDTDSDDDDDGAESPEDAVPFDLVYNRFRRLPPCFSFFHFV